MSASASAHGRTMSFEYAYNLVLTLQLLERETRLPAFREAALSEDGSIWLSLSGTSEADGRWIVVDRWFRPIATLRLSPNLIDIGTAQKDGWLSVGITDLDVRYVARVVVDREPSAPDLPRAH